MFDTRDVSFATNEAGQEVFKVPLIDLENPELKKFIKELNEQGRKLFIQYPKTGIPAKLGSDTLEFTKSKKGKRVLRKQEE